MRRALFFILITGILHVPAVLAQDGDPFIAADSAFSSNQLDQAKAEYEKVFAIAEAEKDALNMGRSLAGQASVAVERGQLDAAQAQLLAALEHFEDARDYGWRGTAHYQLGLVALRRWEQDTTQEKLLDDARDQFKDAEKRFKKAYSKADEDALKLKLRQWEGESVVRQAEVQVLQKDLGDAAKDYEDAAELFVKAEQPRLAAEAYYQQGASLYAEGEARDAAKAYGMAAEFYTLGGDPTWSALAVAARAQAHRDARNVPEALEDFNASLDALEAIPAPAEHRLYAVHGLAETQLFDNNAETALTSFQAARNLAQKENLRSWLPLIEVRIAQIQLDSETERAAALALFNSACPKLSEDAAPAYRLECHIGLGEALREKGEAEAAAEEDANAVALLDKVDTLDPKRKARLKPRLLGNSAELLFKKKAYPAAREAYTEVLSTARDPIAKAHIYHRLALVETSDTEGKLDTAHDHYDEAIDLLEDAETWERVAELYLEEANLYAKREKEYRRAYGKAEKAVEAYEKAEKPLAAARTQVRYAELLFLGGKERNAERAAEDAGEKLKALDQPVESALAYLIAANSLALRGKTSRAIPRLSEAIDTLQKLETPEAQQGLLKAYFLSGRILSNAGDSDAAADFQKGFALADKLGTENIPPTTLAQAYVAVATLEKDKAEGHLKKALEIATAAEDIGTQAEALMGLGDLLLEAGNAQAAYDHFDKAKDLFDEAGLKKLEREAKKRRKQAKKAL